MQSTPITPFLTVAGQITLADIARFKEVGYGLIINNRPDGEEPGQLGHEAAAAEAKRLGLEYRYIPVVTGAITRHDIAAYQNAVLRGPQPVLAHCRSGTRCYLLWAAARVLFDGENALNMVREAAAKGYDIRVLPGLVDKLTTQGED